MLMKRKIFFVLSVLRNDLQQFVAFAKDQFYQSRVKLQLPVSEHWEKIFILSASSVRTVASI